MKRFLQAIMLLSALSANVCVLANTNINSDANATTNTGKSTMSGEAFLEKNKTETGVMTTPSGLQYKILVAGKGSRPAATDIVTVNYEGKLVDGTVFDSSYKRGESTSFPVNGVIPGWVEALQMMPVGSTWELYIPANLAYGSQGAPPVIGPNETLIFKVELLNAKKG